jgi:hypothetical protein
VKGYGCEAPARLAGGKAPHSFLIEEYSRSARELSVGDHRNCHFSNVFKYKKISEVL